jgi:UDP-glucose 6-dehydrogenase
MGRKITNQELYENMLEIKEDIKTILKENNTFKEKMLTETTTLNDRVGFIENIGKYFGGILAGVVVAVIGLLFKKW